MAPLTLHGNTLDPDNDARPGHFPPDASRTNFILLRVEHYLNHHENVELHARGVKVQTLVEDNAESPTYLCRYGPADLAALEALPFVKRAFVYHNDFVVHPRLKTDDLVHRGGIRTKTSGDELLCEVDINLHEDTAQHGDDVFDELCQALPAGSNLEKVNSSSRTLRAWIPERMLSTLAAMDHVASVYPALELKLHTVKARVLVGLPAPAWTAGKLFKRRSLVRERYDGTDEVIAVVDSGLDRANWTAPAKNVHPAFVTGTGTAATTRIANVTTDSVISGTTMSLIDNDGHGTHVAGCALGVYGSSSNPAVGTASGAKVFVQPWQQGSFQDRVQQCVKSTFNISIQNNSWGTSFDPTLKEQLTYNNANPIDAEVYQNRSLLIVFSGGNNGEEWLRWPNGDSTALQVNRQVDAEAAGRNVLTVGASWSDRLMAKDTRTGIEFNARSCVDGTYMWLDPTGKEDPRSIASFSGKGPTNNDLLKPDLVAPGAGILSATSRTPGARRDRPSIDSAGYCYDSNLQYESGTSHATPLVSGIAACLKRAAMTEVRLTPSGFTLKAILINSAVSCKGGTFWYVKTEKPGPPGKPSVKEYDKGTLGDPPDCIQGHGRVSYPRALAHVGGMHRTGSLGAAGWFEHPIGITDAAGTPYERSFALGANTKFCVTLVWVDKPGPTLQHTLTFSAALDVQDVSANVLRALDTQVPDTPKVYTDYILSGDINNPANPVQLGNVLKIKWSKPVPALTTLAPGDSLWVRLTVTVTHCVNSEQIFFALAWLSEP